MKIIDLLKDVEKKASTYNFDGYYADTNWGLSVYDSLENAKEDTVYFIGLTDMVESYYKQNPNSSWKLKGIFQLGHPFAICAAVKDPKYEVVVTRADLQWSLFIFTREEFQKMIIGYNNVDSFNDVDSFNGFFDSEKCDDKEYIKKISGYPVLKNEELYSHYPIIVIANKILQECSDRSNSEMIDCLLNVLNVTNLDSIIETNNPLQSWYETIESVIESWSSPFSQEDDIYHFTEIDKKYFHRKYLSCLSRFKKSVINLLPLQDSKEKIVYLEDMGEFIYSYNEKKFIAQKGDLYFPECENLYSEISDDYVELIDKPQEFSKGTLFRPNNPLDSYYIYLLLQSPLCKDSLTYWDRYQARNNLEYLSIVKPENNNSSYYQNIYEYEKQRYLQIEKDFAEKYSGKVTNEEARLTIQEDLSEIFKCYKNKCYKAAIVLAGSVLEAFLIDWLSEIDHINYFDESKNKYKSKRNPNKENPTLIDYIEDIQFLYPNWKFGTEAKQIQKKRNRIHAKLYINKKDINQKCCLEIIRFLELVIKSRWP
ncbi:MAG: hypothetical protein MJ174_11380 [Treponema sp.]|nr:hypothetical protein [Treponema sp.]